MKVSTAAGAMQRIFGAEETLKMLSGAGFEAVDYSLTQNLISWETGFYTNVSSREFAEHFKRIGKIAADCGIEIYQTHAPYCRPNCVDPEQYSEVWRQTVRAIYAAAHLKSPNIVAHPYMHLDFMNGQNREMAIQKNIEYFGALVPAIKDTGITVCIENLYWAERGQSVAANACSDAEQLSCLIDTLNDMYGPYFAACLDTGHGRAAGFDPAHMMKVLGPRIRTLHIQDCDGAKDSHWLPGQGVIDWDLFLATMKEVGYKGTFNFEIDIYDDFKGAVYTNKTVWAKTTELLYTIGRTMLDYAEVM